MDRHECAQVEVDRPAVATCRYCSAGPCKEYTVESYRTDLVYTRLHHPERAFDRSSADPATLRAAAPHHAAS